MVRGERVLDYSEYSLLVSERKKTKVEMNPEVLEISGPR